jgi:hypothetical protein
MDVEESMDAIQVPQIDPAIEEKWTKFTALVKEFNDEQKSSLNEFWNKHKNGMPKPTKATATHEDLDALIAEVVKISFDGEYVNSGK